MVKDKINWRTMDGNDAVNRQWNSPATPAFFIIDHKGTIRHKWIGKPGEKSVDAAIEKLIHDAEESLPSK